MRKRHDKPTFVRLMSRIPLHRKKLIVERSFLTSIMGSYRNNFTRVAQVNHNLLHIE